MMKNYLSDLPFVHIFDAKNNNAFFWKVTNPLSYKEGEECAIAFVKFLGMYPFMNKSNILHRITCDMSESGLIKSESARGFFNTVDTLLTPKTKTVNKENPTTQKRRTIMVHNMAEALNTTSLKILNFLAIIGWIEHSTLSPTEDALSAGVVRCNAKSPFGFTFTRKGESLLTQKFNAMSK